MSRHQLDLVSFVFGLFFLVLAVVGLATALAITDDGLTWAAVLAVVVAGVVAAGISVRGMQQRGAAVHRNEE